MPRRRSPADVPASLEDVGCLIVVLAIGFAICAGAMGSCIREARTVDMAPAAAPRGSR